MGTITKNEIDMITMTPTEIKTTLETIQWLKGRPQTLEVKTEIQKLQQRVDEIERKDKE
jgi:prefoldin subunit 5